MDFAPFTGALDRKRTHCLLIGIYEKLKLSPSAETVNRGSNGALAKILKREQFKARPGDTLLLHQLPGCRADRVLVVGLGKKQDLGPTQYVKSIDAAIKTLTSTQSKQALCALLDDIQVEKADLHWKARQLAMRFEQGCYRFTAMKSETEDLPVLSSIDLVVTDKEHRKTVEKGVHEGKSIASGINFAKDLANLPGNICTPTYLADQALKLADRYSALKVTILEESDMEKLGMGALLSVSRGSRQPAKLIVLEYQGTKNKDKPIALIGKGLTFDAGGISIKPAQNMDEMKYDMCGGASVMGTFQAVAEMALPLNLVGIIPASENLPDGDANKPGDIVKTMAGKTVEILNTDAEGRLILCDALTYTQKFDPELVIDIATLTGACVVALGHHASGLLGNDDHLCQDILKAGQTSLDRAWQLPLWDDYQEQLKSNFADMANIGGRDAGTITAACFLARFATKFKWAHLDIAGTAWNSGNNKGATGRPVPLLTQFLLDRTE